MAILEESTFWPVLKRVLILELTPNSEKTGFVCMTKATDQLLGLRIFIHVCVCACGQVARGKDTLPQKKNCIPCKHQNQPNVLISLKARANNLDWNHNVTAV